MRGRFDLSHSMFGLGASEGGGIHVLLIAVRSRAKLG
jgi:hypothetical protein